MKTTLKVAELASFIYAFLFFGSLCINMGYYSIFNINITAYMNMSEILLLFLGQPILYLPILISIIFIIINPTAWPQGNHSYKYKYMSIASTNDTIFLYLILFSMMFLYFLYGLKIEITYICLSLTILIWFFSPSQGNIFYKYLLTLFDYTPKGFRNLWRFIKHKKIAIKTTNYKRALVINKKEAVSKDKKMDFYSYYRILLLESKFTDNDKKIINMIYSHKLLYCITITYIASIISMSSVNIFKADSIKNGTTPPDKIINLSFTNPTDSLDTAKLIFVGESQQYIYLFEPKEKETIIVSRDLVKTQRIKFNTERQKVIKS